MATKYISPTGSNAADGSTGTPWATLAYASTQLAAGDTLRMKAGVYINENGGSWVGAGNSGAHITVMADTTPVEFDGGDAWEQWLILGNGAAYTDFSGILLTHYVPLQNGMIIINGTANHLTFDLNADSTNGGAYSLTRKSGGTYTEHIYYLSNSAVDTIGIQGTLNATNLSGASVHLFNNPGPTNIDLHDIAMTGGHWGILVASTGVTGLIRNCTSTGADIPWEVTAAAESGYGITWTSNSPAYPFDAPPASSSTYRTAVLALNPKGYWRLGVAGVAAHSEVGIGYGGAKAGGYTDGVASLLASDANPAVALNGSTGYISVARRASMDVGDTVTVIAWVKRGVSAVSHTIAMKGYGTWALALGSDNRVIWMRGDWTVLAHSSVTLTADGLPHMVAATKTGSTRKVYIDGVDVTVLDTNDTLVDNTSPIEFGRWPSGVEYLNGTLDEIALFGTALTAGEIANLYTLGSTAPVGVPVILLGGL